MHVKVTFKIIINKTIKEMKKYRVSFLAKHTEIYEECIHEYVWRTMHNTLYKIN